ncbi:Protein of unknown function [Noviherbaspirillum humi]|uniref:DUF3135 domain-containing protein n=1 Tax=Noviherbaspirillum humi TaxID=1688639 RepID=A0A239C6I6_9BURK|nr:DUF3135 domain-containing protein [Noviherbaspirillum humi]SNS15231.1 Protein of unknown function [Noviherbaspirillum humi]
MSHDSKHPSFDMLSSLYQDDPQAFEAYRRHLLREAIDSAPEEHRLALEQLLVTIEAARQEARTPLEAATIASRLMHDSVRRLDHHWKNMQAAVAELQTAVVIERARGTF